MSTYQDKWYKDLKKAPWNPPNHWFGIVWSTLYTLMAISAALVLANKKCKGIFCYPMRVFMIQLFFNLTWTSVFFTLQMPVLALVDLILIIGLSVWTLIEFYKINKLAGILLVPYVAWLLVALSLNTYIVAYN